MLTSLTVISGVSGSACAAVAVDHVSTDTAILTRVGTAFVDIYKQIHINGQSVSQYLLIYEDYVTYILKTSKILVLKNSEFCCETINTLIVVLVYSLQIILIRRDNYVTSGLRHAVGHLQIFLETV